VCVCVDDCCGTFFFVSNGCSCVSRFDGSVFFSRWRSFEALDGWDDDAASRVLVLLVCENYADLFLESGDRIRIRGRWCKPVRYLCVLCLLFCVFLGRRLYTSYILGFVTNTQIRDSKLFEWRLMQFVSAKEDGIAYGRHIAGLISYFFVMSYPKPYNL